MEKIETDAEFKTTEKVARAFITRFEREEREDEYANILDRSVQVVFLCFVLFAHWFNHCTRVGECRTMFVHPPLVSKRYAPPEMS